MIVASVIIVGEEMNLSSYEVLSKLIFKAIELKHYEAIEVAGRYDSCYGFKNKNVTLTKVKQLYSLIFLFLIDFSVIELFCLFTFISLF